MGFGKNNRRRGKRVVTRKQKSTFKFTTKYVGDKIVKVFNVSLLNNSILLNIYLETLESSCYCTRELY